MEISYGTPSHWSVDFSHKADASWPRPLIAGLRGALSPSKRPPTFVGGLSFVHRSNGAIRRSNSPRNDRSSVSTLSTRVSRSPSRRSTRPKPLRISLRSVSVSFCNRTTSVRIPTTSRCSAAVSWRFAATSTEMTSRSCKILTCASSWSIFHRRQDVRTLERRCLTISSNFTISQETVIISQFGQSTGRESFSLMPHSGRRAPLGAPANGTDPLS